MSNVDISKTDIHCSDDTILVGEEGMTINYECSAPFELLCEYFEVPSLSKDEYFEFETTWHSDTNDITAVLSIVNSEEDLIMTRDFPLSDKDTKFFRDKMEEFCKSQSAEFISYQPKSYLQCMHSYWSGKPYFPSI